ncbi:hypothetical protein [Agromyces archimandritae]|uniref:Uncharacterized protein n=1 Tax=Agromyces archimandritae TaxID=2781962 RepID=A0A975FMW7_9MICO|nr:hypothetical protein [Agromyces archimandritae]QTX04856.1 hypothetical protein G127AT_00885 [Agromyces archimandritae]
MIEDETEALAVMSAPLTPPSTGPDTLADIDPPADALKVTVLGTFVLLIEWYVGLSPFHALELEVTSR